MKTQILTALLLIITAGLISCHTQPGKLPMLGDADYRTNPVTGITDTIYPVITNFTLTDQDSNQVTNNTFADKIYVADFIFLSCPTICPTMTKEMLKVYHAFDDNRNVNFLSHTIDPEYDTIPRLKAYSTSLGVQTERWHFVTAPADTIYKLAASYYATVYPDSTIPGGFTHSGGFLLIDQNRHIRGVYDGTDSTETGRLIRDIHILLKEKT
ncbi:SCO family protein [Chitinophaga sancti]|uniref:SCO family protein n=1 Tax=Chitinophaga sancti TaxID=1004 RepID=UPI002A74F15E|nr:SCO family protein [Chitinophaga sancti]WPQ60664.1 SCO family protein [Chitinophaga sancti]